MSENIWRRVGKLWGTSSLVSENENPAGKISRKDFLIAASVTVAGLALAPKSALAATVTQDQPQEPAVGQAINDFMLARQTVNASWGIGEQAWGVQAIAAALNGALDFEGAPADQRIPTRFARRIKSREGRSTLETVNEDYIDWVGDQEAKYASAEGGYADGKGGLYISTHPSISPTYNDTRPESEYSKSGGAKAVWHLFAVISGTENYKYDQPDFKCADRLNVEFDPDRLLAALPEIAKVMQHRKSAAANKKLHEILDGCTLLSHGFIWIPKEYRAGVPKAWEPDLEGNVNTGRMQVFGTTSGKIASFANKIFKQPFLSNHNNRGGDNKLPPGATGGGKKGGGENPTPGGFKLVP